MVDSLPPPGLVLRHGGCSVSEGRGAAAALGVLAATAAAPEEGGRGLTTR